jgi:hypothetical protein
VTALRNPTADPTAAPKDRGFLAEEHLSAVERWVLIFGAALLLGSVLLAGPRAQVGALAGAGMSLINARVVGSLGRWASRGTADEARTRMGILLGLFQLKLLILAGLIYLTVRYLPVAPMWLLFGLTILPLGIFARAIEFRPRDTIAERVADRSGEPAEREKVL